jgi:hypothetical protein
MNNLPLHTVSPARLREIVLQSREKQATDAARIAREQLNPAELIGQMLDLAQEADYADAERLEQLKFKADVFKTVLKKCMPDLRSTEVTERSQKTSRLVIDMGDVIDGEVI